MSLGVILSLCDYSGIFVQPWVDAGYSAVLVDPQHSEGFTQDGRITRIGNVVDSEEVYAYVRSLITAKSLCYVAGWPVCTQLAVSGTARWADKRAADPYFQAKAMQLVHECRVIGRLAGVPGHFENPVSAISSIYKKPSHTFHPFEYGGYLPEEDQHPLYPEYIPPRDAYGKKTCLWTFGGFAMPEKKPVPIAGGQTDGQGQSAAQRSA